MARTVRVKKPHTVNVGGKTYGVGRHATRTISTEGNTRTVVIKKANNDTITRTLTKSDDAKNTRLGSYARAHKTVNSDGSTTFQKKGGGTVTRSVAVSEGAKTYAPRNKVGVPAPSGDRRPKPIALGDGQSPAPKKRGGRAQTAGGYRVKK